MRKSSRQQRFLLASALILIFAFWVRIDNLYGLPIFVDEADHLLWAQRFSLNDPTYPLFVDGKYLMIAILAQFKVWGPSPLWVGRAAVVILSSLSCAACIALAKMLFRSPQSALCAGIIYACLPYAVLHERQVMADPLSASFGSLSLVLSIIVMKSGRWRSALAASLLLSLAILTKFFSLLYLLFPLLILFSSPFRQWRQGVKRYSFIIALTVFFSALILAGLFPLWGKNDPTWVGQGVRYVGCPPLLCAGDLNRQMELLRYALESFADMTPPYFSWGIVALAAAAWAILRSRGAAALSLYVVIVLSTFLFANIATYVPPRYLQIAVVPLVALAAVSLIRLPNLFPDRYRFAVSIALPLIVITPLMTNTALITYAPHKARLAYLEREALSGGFMNSAVRDASLEILKRESNSKFPPVIIVKDGIHISSVAAYFDRSRIDVREEASTFLPDMGRWLFDRQNIYIVDQNVPSDHLSGVFTEELGQYWQLNGKDFVRLRRVTGVDTASRAKLYRDFFIPPEKVSQNYQNFVNDLPSDTPITLLVYPPNQIEQLAPMLSTYHQVRLQPLGDSWPLDVAEVQRELGLMTAKGDRIKIVFLDEAKGDPRKQIETWLNSNLFWLDEQWYGSLRVMTFAGKGSTSKTITAKVRWGDFAVLEAIDMMDLDVARGDILRLRLVWRAVAPTAQSFKVFTHVFLGSSISAQHDSIPLNGLRPTSGWQVGETIFDQFAIQIPSGASAGIYQFRVGLYGVSDQQRLPAVLPDGSTMEFFVGGTIAIR